MAGVLACLSLVAAACGGDDDDGDLIGLDALTSETLDLTGDDTPTSEAPAAPGGGGIVDDAVLSDLDANGDGVLQLAVATPGVRNDGAYYQALVEAVEEYAAGRGWPAPQIEDQIPSDDPRPRMEELAESEPDVIFVGASEIAEPMPELAETYSDIFWYCSCGAGFTPGDFYAQSQDSGAEISFTAGYAAAMLMRDARAAGEDVGTVTAFIGGFGLPFETESLEAYRAGVEEAVKGEADAGEYATVYERAGGFDDYFPNEETGVTPGAKAAYDQVVAANDNIGAVYPYLGNAHLPVAHDADAAGYFVMTAGSSTGCEDSPVSYEHPGDPEGETRTVTYDMEVRFDGGDYLEVILDELFSGELLEGDVRYFATGVEETVIGDDGQPQQVFLNGAEICGNTPRAEAQKEELDALFQRVADGEFDALLGQISADAYTPDE
ncbi:MAG: hypothetical protein S0880_35500 [Actinomycetota bacterium]|nr:hypothetical protein [Actinomycetota bacterium]